MDEQKKMFTNKSVTLFLVIVISVSAIFETIVIALRAMGLAVFLMWVPTIAAIIAGCISQKESNGKISFKKLTKGGAIYMGETIQLLTTADVRKLLKIGNKTCLELFHREDFPCQKFGRAYKITEENLKEYLKTRHVNNEEDER